MLKWKATQAPDMLYVANVIASDGRVILRRGSAILQHFVEMRHEKPGILSQQLLKLKPKEKAMGFESFQVRLKGGRSTRKEAIDTLMSLDGVVRDEDSELTPGWPCFLARDGLHAVEMEVTDKRASISCRFTLCHPPSVDTAFLELVRRLMEALPMRVKICDDVTPEHEEPFSLDRFDEFSKACRHYIAARRNEWKSAFGNQELAATTAEAHQHIILPHCIPGVEKAG
jgi:hypothetical protein